MNTPLPYSSSSSLSLFSSKNSRYPTALETACHAVLLLEDDPLFNAGHGAVFTRDGINELEASVMVSRGFAKHGVGVAGLRHVKNPILLAKAILERGDQDLNGQHNYGSEHNSSLANGAQSHILLSGDTAERLACHAYNLEMCSPNYYFTQRRWDEHVRALENERNSASTSATWSPHEYLPQGTCGAVVLDRDGVVCCATSTGGLTNKLAGRIGDTPIVGAGFWAERFQKPGIPRWAMPLFDGALKEKGRCVEGRDSGRPPYITMVDMGVSGTGNGDSFIRLAAGRQVGAIARYRPTSTLAAVKEVAGPGGELQKSAGDRWGRTGEGAGGMIAIEGEVVQDQDGNVVAMKHKVISDYNCGGFFRAWLDEEGNGVFRAWREGVNNAPGFCHEGEGIAVNLDNDNEMTM